LINIGLLDASFTYTPPRTNVSRCFKFEPNQGTIAPGESQTIQISFKASVTGNFSEEFPFSVAGSPMPVILLIQGFVDGPRLHFNTPRIEFGDVSFGFIYTKTCRLTNTSMEPVTFKLRVQDDGSARRVSCYDQILKPNDPSWRKGIHFYVEPKEFTMTPSQGTILPQEYQDIEVTLCSNTVMEFYRSLYVDVEGVGEAVLALTITARCIVPNLKVHPYIVVCDECRLKEPYESKLVVVNPTCFPGCYGLVPQKRKADTPVLYSSPNPCGIIQPFSMAEIPLTIEVQTLGKHSVNVL
ncbi:HYDIN protein, partial [Oreocharis arfaki]|nr:HYDIN protein [Oreocharis arfaki]